MAIAPTGAIFNKLVFGSVDSSTYGIYITGEAVYNAPERAVQLVSVAGRNGAIEIDQGRWENIEVTYSAGCFAETDADFATAIRNFRNAVCSQIGYQRLTDTYNPNEYRMGLYMSGLDVTPASMNRAGKFDITFNCKPQRWLASGETVVTVASGGKLTNPTLYNASPLLALEGYGTIGFNGYEIELSNSGLGEITITSQRIFEYPVGETSITLSFPQDTSLLNTGDPITCAGMLLRFRFSTYPFSVYQRSISDSNSSFQSSFEGSPTLVTSKYVVQTIVPSFTFNKGSSISLSDTVTINGTRSGSGSTSFEITCTLSISADGDEIELTAVFSSNVSYISLNDVAYNSIVYEVTGDSSMSLLGHPTYVDCDLGECYRIESGVPISINSKVALGSDLPTLATGENEITYDNTFTEVKITPRWWQL